MSQLDSRDDVFIPTPNLLPAQPIDTQHALRAAMMPPQTLQAPVHDFNWNEIGLRYALAPPISNPDLNQSIAKVRFGTDFQAVLVVDGSYQGNKNAPLYQQAGCGFICHLLDRNETWIAAQHLPKSKSNNSAPVAEAEATVMGLNFLRQKSISRALIIHDNFDMHAFILNKHRSTKKCSRYAKLKEIVISLLSKFDAIYGCHVRSHQSASNGLAENEAADELAQIFMRNPHLPNLIPTKLHQNLSISSTILDSLQTSSRLNIDASTLNFQPMPLIPSAAQCDVCGCPSHQGSGCFMHRSKPCMSPFTREKPVRPTGFCEGFLHPDAIAWDNAPTVMNDHMFVHFLGTMFSLALKSETLLSAYNGLVSLSEHYYFSPLRSKLCKKKHRIRQDAAGPCLDDDVLRHQFEEEARKLHTFARIAHDRKWGRAMSFVHKTERINPLDQRLSQQWGQIHPEPPTSEDELFLDYEPSSFQIFELDRYALSKKIDSWDVTKSAGLNGFPPAFLIHFNNLTAKTEDPENPNPYFTSFVLFMQLLASGKMSELREVALNYKGAFLNKLPANVGFKVRNLGMSDVFHRIAAYSVLTRSNPHAIDAGLLTEFDLGSGRLGGIDKFVKIAQALAADPDVVVLSSDLEKAYNSVLRTDTWNAIQEINFPPLTQWFIYTYGSSPVVNYVIDARLPISGDNIKSVRMKIGLPQGDSLSGFLFSITLRYVLRKYFRSLSSRSAIFQFATVLDDTLLAFNSACTPKFGQHIIDFISSLRAHNFKINVEKSICFCKTSTISIINEVRKVRNLPLTSDGFDVCKIPVGTSLHIQAYVSKHYHSRIQDAYSAMLHIWNALQYLKNQERLNTFYIFLRLCFASKFVYWLRNLQPPSAQPVSHIIDAKIDALSAKLYPQLPSHLVLRQPLFNEMLDLSKQIESLPLSMNGSGVTRMVPICFIGHYATCAESFSTVLNFMAGLKPDLSSSQSSMSPDGLREQLFPLLNATIMKLMGMCEDKMKTNDFALSPSQEYRGVQKLVSTAFFSTLHGAIINKLPLEHYKAWLSSRRTTFTSLSLNSSVRHITFHRPPLDKVFPMVFAMRSLRPIFHNYQCDCGEIVDVCGLHVLRCGKVSPKPFTSLHNKVRDATVKALFDYTRRNAPAPLKIFSEVDRFHLCEVDRYYHTASDCSRHRADAVVIEETDPFHPRFLDFVQAQIDDFDESRLMRHVEAAYQRKITSYVHDHVSFPVSHIIPIAFSSNGVFHSASLLFIDWFLCQASRVPVCEPPAIDKLRVLQAMSSAIVDQSAAILTCHFSKFIDALHVSAFPMGVPLLQHAHKPARRVADRRSPSLALGVTEGVLGGALISCSQSSTPILPGAPPNLLSIDGSARPALGGSSRSSARIQSQGVRIYTSAGGWWTNP